MRSCASDNCSAVAEGAGWVEATCAVAGVGAAADSPAEARGLLLAAQRIEPAARAATSGETTAAADQLARVGRVLVIVALVLIVVVFVIGLVVVIAVVLVVVAVTAVVVVLALVVLAIAAVAAG